MTALRLIWATLKRELSVARQYLASTLATVALGIGIVFGVLIGGRQLLPQSIASGGLAAVVSGVLVLFFVPILVFGTSQMFIGEAQTGTLEQMAMSRYGLLSLSLAAQVVKIGLSAVRAVPTIVAVAALGSVHIHANVPAISTLLILTAIGTQGIGLLLGGLTLAIKRAPPLAGFLGLGLVGAVAAPVGTVPVLGILPVALGSSLLRRVMVQGAGLGEMPREVFLLGVQSAVLVTIGVIGFWKFERLARRQGSIGHY